MTPIASAVDRCRVAQPAWAARTVADRLHCVREFRHLLVERADFLAAAVAADIARPPAEVIATELLPTASACKFLWQTAARTLRPKRIGWRPLWLMGCRDTVHRRPHGVVALIGTWNYPIFLTVVPVLHALVAGNAVAWKPSEFAPRTAAALDEVFRAAGVPADVLVRLPATRAAGPELADTDIDFLHFTGSDNVGRRLAARLGERLIPSALELSGCDAVFVLTDADVTLAARAAWYGATMNRGQTCMATRRAFVHRSVYDRFVEALKPLVEAEPPVTLVSPGQAEKALHVVADSGGTPLRAGSVSDGFSATVFHASGSDFPPTVILDPPADSPVCTAATFAPLLAVLPFDDLDVAVVAANTCPFGLAAAVFTADRAAADALAAKLPVGAVTVNDVIVPTAHPETPFGGRKASGWGVTQGTEGLLQMTVAQVVTHRKGTFRPHVETALTGDPSADATARGLLRFTHGRTVWQRWRGFWQLVGGLRKYGKAKGN